MALALVDSRSPERIALPDVRRLDRMPSLPEWVVSRVASMKDVCQPTLADAVHRTIPTLPANLMLIPEERAETERHVAELDELCAQTPENGEEWEAATLVIVTKLMLDRPAQQQNDAGAEATGEAFMDALDNLPSWAVAAAVRRWGKGDCGTNNLGQPYDYHWRPAPADLYRIAFAERWRIKDRASTLRKLLAAEPLIVFDDEHRAKMCAKLATLPILSSRND